MVGGHLAIRRGEGRGGKGRGRGGEGKGMGGEGEGGKWNDDSTYYLLTGCKGRTRKYKPKVFHTARACEFIR